MDRPLLLSLPDAARALGIGLSTFRTLVDRGEIATTTIGRRRLVLAESLRAFVARGAGNTDAPKGGRA